ncbi:MULTISPECIES: hypothetical protein [unclassified Stenotrophomonas]|uniref:hypothetical protein n=1 Tax=unclassified Stenotrophomonas TaxID=196198 RepID=UPI003012CB42
MANIKYADTSNPLIAPTDDDQVMFKTGAGGDARAPLVQPKGYIDGLKLEWVSGTQVRVTPGAAYVPGPKRIAELASAVVLTPSLAASTWYHVYLTVAGGVVSAEASTTAPAAPYTGTARAKTGDTSRRYIGSFRTNASSQVIRFVHSPSVGAVKYLTDINGSGLQVLSNGNSTTSVTVSVAGVVPVTGFVMDSFAENTGTTVVYINNPDMGAAGPASILQFLRANGVIFGEMSINDLQQFNYSLNSASTNGLTVWCVGYKFMR